VTIQRQEGYFTKSFLVPAEDQVNWLHIQKVLTRKKGEEPVRMEGVRRRERERERDNARSEK
jgi:hypothetical protein